MWALQKPCLSPFLTSMSSRSSPPRVRTLHDTTGSIETARQRCNLSNVEDRRVDQVIDVMSDVTVAALQEAKWYGSEI